MSRWAFPATLDQVLTLVALGLVWRSLPARGPAEAGRRRWLRLAGMALAGGLVALAAYAYHTGRFTPVIVARLALLNLVSFLALAAVWHAGARLVAGLSGHRRLFARARLTTSIAE